MNCSKLQRGVRRLVVVAMVTAVVLGACQLALGGLSECIDATCRISQSRGSGSVGTGCAIAAIPATSTQQGGVFVLTNAHVVGRVQSVYCEFWQQGHKSSWLPGRVIIRDAGPDMALVYIDGARFGGRFPKIVPLAPVGVRVIPGCTLLSAGCANGRWPSAWRGHAISETKTTLTFRPGPENGRSGSAIFDGSGTYVIGLLHSRSGGKVNSRSVGYATSLSVLQSRFNTAYHVAAGGCQGPDCPSCPGGILGNRGYGQQRQRPQPPQESWPSLPPAVPAPPAIPAIPMPVVDLGPLEIKLDRIAELIVDLRGVVESQAEELPLPESADPEAVEEVEDTATMALQTAEQALAATEALGQATKDSLLATNGRIDKVNESAKAAAVAAEEKLQRVDDKNGNVIERLRARISDARESGAEGVRDIAKAVAKDVVLSHGGVLGLVVVIGLIFVYRDVKDKRQTGDPLFVEKVVERVRDRRRGVQRKVRKVLRRDDPDDDEVTEEIVEEE